MAWTSRDLSPDRCDTTMIQFGVDTRDLNGVARLGRLTTPMGTLKRRPSCPSALGRREGDRIGKSAMLGFGLILNNAYDLYLGLGMRLWQRWVNSSFTGWSGALLTDSGRFQIFSLSNCAR